MQNATFPSGKTSLPLNPGGGKTRFQKLRKHFEALPFSSVSQGCVFLFLLVCVWLKCDSPPILSITAPSTRPEHVSMTIILLPAWMFPKVSIWARVSYLKWLEDERDLTNIKVCLEILPTSSGACQKNLDYREIFGKSISDLHLKFAHAETLIIKRLVMKN